MDGFKDHCMAGMMAECGIISPSLSRNGRGGENLPIPTMTYSRTALFKEMKASLWLQATKKSRYIHFLQKLIFHVMFLQ